MLPPYPEPAVPFLESKIVSLLRATGGANGGMTADELSRLVFEPVGRVRMTLLRLLEKRQIWVTSGHGMAARYLPSDVGSATPTPDAHPVEERPAEPALRRLRLEVQQLRDELTRAHHDTEVLRRLLRNRPSHTADSDHILGSRVEELLRLCHPDRHDNSDKANEITRWLLQLRKGR